MTHLIGEILQNIRSMDKDATMAYLLENKTKQLTELFKMAQTDSYDSEVLNIKWARNKSPIGLTETDLYGEVKMLKHFLKSSPVSIKRRKQLLIQIVESLHPLESDVFISVINQTFFIENSTLTPESIQYFLETSKTQKQ